MTGVPRHNKAIQVDSGETDWRPRKNASMWDAAESPKEMRAAVIVERRR